MSKIVPENNGESETSSATEEKSIVLNDVEENIYKKNDRLSDFAKKSGGETMWVC